MNCHCFPIEGWYVYLSGRGREGHQVDTKCTKLLYDLICVLCVTIRLSDVVVFVVRRVLGDLYARHS
jgi:hypothetical protein